jgi:hypothetical protein
MGHAVGVLNQRLDCAERLGQGEDPTSTAATVRAADSPPCTVNETIPPNARICACAASWPAWPGQPGVVDPVHGRVSSQASATCCGIRRSGGPSGRPASSPPAGRGSSRRARDRPGGVLEKGDPFGHASVGRGDEPSDHVAVPTQVLGGGVDDHVSAVSDGLLEVRRGEGVVDHTRAPRAWANSGQGRAMSAMRSKRVGRRLHPDHAGGGPPRITECLGVVERDRCECRPAGACTWERSR